MWGEKQFWPTGRRVSIILPTSGSPEMQVLLDKVYAMDAMSLKKEWSRKLFAGEIPAAPSAASSEKAAALVRDLTRPR
jgi:hypothetical protein